MKGKGEIQLDDEIFENQAIVDERISIPEEYISDKAKREIILSIMQEVLSDVQYQTVIMHYFNEMTVDEISEVFECSRGTVLSRLNYSRAKMKTAIEDYENKSGDKLHGVVVVPFFTTIFKEEAKSLAVPNITIKLPNGESLVTAASKGVSTAVKTSTATAVKAGAVTAVKTKAIAMACGITLLFAGTTVGTSLLAGCKSDKVPTATTSAQATTAPAVTVPKEVKADDVKTTVSNNNNSNKGNTEKKEDTKSNTSKKDNTSSKTDTKKDNSSSKADTSKNDQKPTQKPASKPNTSSKNDTKPAQKPESKPSESSKTETPTAKPKKKVWVVDYKTVHHEGYWKVTGTHEEPVYGWVGYNVCNDCGKQLTNANLNEHLLWEAEENGGRGSYHYEKEYVQTSTKTIEDKKWVEPWDEKVESGGHYEYK